MRPPFGCHLFGCRLLQPLRHRHEQDADDDEEQVFHHWNCSMQRHGHERSTPCGRWSRRSNESCAAYPVPIAHGGQRGVVILEPAPRPRRVEPLHVRCPLATSPGSVSPGQHSRVVVGVAPAAHGVAGRWPRRVRRPAWWAKSPGWPRSRGTAFPTGPWRAAGRWGWRNASWSWKTPVTTEGSIIAYAVGPAVNGPLHPSPASSTPSPPPTSFPSPATGNGAS